MSDGRRFFSGVTLERAVLEAAGHFGVDPGALRYELVDKQHGFTHRRRVVIRVDPNAPAKEVDANPSAGQSAFSEERAPVDSADAEPPTVADTPLAGSEQTDVSEPVAAVEQDEQNSSAAAPGDTERRRTEDRKGMRLPATERARFDALSRADGEVEQSARRWLGCLLDLADLTLEFSIRQGPEELELELTGADCDAVTEDEGEVLHAIQHLLPRLMASDLDEMVPLRVDCQGFQELRMEELRRRGQAAAAEARATGESVSLEPLAPADRRIVHLAVADDATVETESIGRGFFKRVTVRPV